MNTQTETLSPDQAQFLASIENVEQQLLPQVDQGGALGAPAVVPQTDKADENAEMLQSLIDVLSPALPFLTDIYTPKKVKQIAVAYTAVEVKRGWNLKQYVNEELTLALVAGPPTIMAVLTAKAYIAQMKAQAAQLTNEAGTDGHQ